MNVLCIGDIVGRPGRSALIDLLDVIKKREAIDFTIVNAENSAGGSGLTSRIAKQFNKIGCNVLTLGDHVWDQKELETYLDETDFVVRPLNFPEGTPGVGYCIKELDNGVKVGVINLIGRVFMRFNVDCPFLALDKAVEEIRRETPIIFVDMHAETTSEKVAIGHYATGKVSCLFGTHTHIQTADDKVLDGKTAYITDLGMTGPYDSVIGQEKDNIIDGY